MNNLVCSLIRWAIIVTISIYRSPVIKHSYINTSPLSIRYDNKITFTSSSRGINWILKLHRFHCNTVLKWKISASSSVETFQFTRARARALFLNVNLASREFEGAIFAFHSRVYSRCCVPGPITILFFGKS